MTLTHHRVPIALQDRCYAWPQPTLGFRGEKGQPAAEPVRIDVLIIGGDAAGLSALEHAAGELSLEAVRDWGTAFRHLISECPPRALVISVDAINERAAALIRALRRRGFLVPTAAYLPDVSASSVQRAWPMAAHGVQLLLGCCDLATGIRELMRGDLDVVAHYLSGRFAVRSSLVQRFLFALADGGSILTMSVANVARELGSTRTALYVCLKREGLPAVEHCQMLFRLLDGVRVLSQGGTTHDAAEAANFSDDRSFRRALRRRLKLTARDARRSCEWRCLVERWIEKAGPAQPASRR